jgi:hypothetical protein
MKTGMSAILMKVFVLAVLLFAVFGICVQCDAGQWSGYTTMAEWENWARLRAGSETGLACSYDRSGGNQDYSQYESPSGPITAEIDTIAKTITGPGVIYRFWMPHLVAKKGFAVRMYFDGESTPRIDTDNNTLLSGNYGTGEMFRAPLVTTCAGGQVSYEPIPFAKSLRIETENMLLPDSDWSSNRHYYQYTYATFPPGTPVDSYNGNLNADQQQTKDVVVDMFDNPGRHPAGDDDNAVSLTTSASTVAAGTYLTLAGLDGPGIVASIIIDAADADDVELAGMKLQVFYDDETQAAIDVSLSHFFGAGNGRAIWSSLAVGTDSADNPNAFYSYWPIPFREAISIRLYNQTDNAISIGAAKVKYTAKDIDSRMCYLNAVEKTSTKVPGQIYHNILSTTGRGHYVGDLLYVEQSDYSFAMLEGDDVITVDAAKTQYGTGLEDTYNGGYYYNWVGVQDDEPEGGHPRSAIRPLHGILYVDRSEQPGYARADQYRWRIADAVTFTRSIDVNVESRYSVDGCTWTSVAFWYRLPCPLADLDGDCEVGIGDLAALAAQWISTDCIDDPPCGGADMTGDLKVDLSDFSELASELGQL